MTSILVAPYEEIIAYKVKQIAQQQVVTPIDSLRALAKMQDRPRDVSSHVRVNRVALLAELQNPAFQAGEVDGDDPGYDPVALARRLIRQGAQGLVVATDKRYYGGGVVHLTLVSNAVDVPVVRRDYILDEYQVVETRAAGADGLLVTTPVVNSTTLRRLVSATQRNLMTAVVEVHSADELEAVLPLEPRLIAINNRHPLTREVDLTLTPRLVERVPGHITVITMGGLHSPYDVARVASGVDGVLVPQDMLLDPQQAAALRHILGIADENIIPNTEPPPFD
jgi:indole-3-glycerol phosphate synthase